MTDSIFPKINKYLMVTGNHVNIPIALPLNDYKLSTFLSLPLLDHI